MLWTGHAVSPALRQTVTSTCFSLPRWITPTTSQAPSGWGWKSSVKQRGGLPAIRDRKRSLRIYPLPHHQAPTEPRRFGSAGSLSVPSLPPFTLGLTDPRQQLNAHWTRLGVIRDRTGREKHRGLRQRQLSKRCRGTHSPLPPADQCPSTP